MTYRERREHKVYIRLMQMVPGLEERLMNGSDEDVLHVAELVGQFRPLSESSIDFVVDHCQIQKGASGARADDTKSLKGSILDWITPRGQSLNPPLARNIKSDRGFNHERTGALLCPASLNWSDLEYVINFNFYPHFL